MKRQHLHTILSIIFLVLLSPLSGQITASAQEDWEPYEVEESISQEVQNAEPTEPEEHQEEVSQPEVQIEEEPEAVSETIPQEEPVSLETQGSASKPQTPLFSSTVMPSQAADKAVPNTPTVEDDEPLFTPQEWEGIKQVLIIGGIIIAVIIVCLIVFSIVFYFLCESLLETLCEKLVGAVWKQFRRKPEASPVKAEVHSNSKKP